MKYEKPEVDTVVSAAYIIQGGKGGTPFDNNLPPQNHTTPNAYEADE